MVYYYCRLRIRQGSHRNVGKMHTDGIFVSKPWSSREETEIYLK